MVMMLQYCECCEREQWFTLGQELTSKTTAKFVWRCNLCQWVVDYTTPTTALEQYLDELLDAKGEIFQ